MFLDNYSEYSLFEILRSFDREGNTEAAKFVAQAIQEKREPEFIYGEGVPFVVGGAGVALLGFLILLSKIDRLKLKIVKERSQFNKEISEKNEEINYLNKNKNNSYSSEELRQAKETISALRKEISELTNQMSYQGVNNNYHNDYLLEKANETIRKANLRINELKGKLKDSDSRIEALQREINYLMRKVKEKTQNNTGDTYKEPYEVLGLKPEATFAEIKKRYKQLSIIYHPDKAGINGEKMMKLINKAYNDLSNDIN